MPLNFLQPPPVAPAAPRLNFFGPPPGPEEETPWERWQRENKERMEAAGALPTEEMPALQEGSIGNASARIGKDIAAGALGLGEMALKASALPALGPFAYLLPQSPLGRKAEELQETPAFGSRRGERSERMIEGALAAGNSPAEAAIADTAAATLGLADPLDLMPAGALGGILARFGRKPAREAAEAAARLLPGGTPPGAAEDLARAEFQAHPLREDPRTLLGGAKQIEADLRAGRITEAQAEAQLLALGRSEAMVSDPHLEDLYAKTQAIGPGLAPETPPGVPGAPAAPARALEPPAAATPPAASRAAGEPLPFQSNFRERFNLNQEAGDAMEEMIRRDLPAYQAQRRAGGPSNEEVSDAVERLAAANGWTKSKFLETLPGTTMNREELMVLDSMVERRRLDISDIARKLEDARANNLADVDRLQLEQAAAIIEHNALLRTSVGASSELGRALQSRQQIVRALRRCFGAT